MTVGKENTEIEEPSSTTLNTGLSEHVGDWPWYLCPNC